MDPKHFRPTFFGDFSFDLLAFFGMLTFRFSLLVEILMDAVDGSVVVMSR